ncbi:hypothetical protein BGX26_007438 [Mortierella sp. AD094]|nr:hypothetical protein BGX26_007438 [Mortierella sp. AD094]
MVDSLMFHNNHVSSKEAMKQVQVMVALYKGYCDAGSEHPNMLELYEMDEALRSVAATTMTKVNPKHTEQHAPGKISTGSEHHKSEMLSDTKLKDSSNAHAQSTSSSSPTSSSLPQDQQQNSGSLHWSHKQYHGSHRRSSGSHPQKIDMHH